MAGLLQCTQEDISKEVGEIRGVFFKEECSKTTKAARRRVVELERVRRFI